MNKSRSFTYRREHWSFDYDALITEHFITTFIPMYVRWTDVVMLFIYKL